MNATSPSGKPRRTTAASTPNRAGGPANAQELTPPAPVMAGGWIAIAQSIVGFAYAILLIVREAAGYQDESIVYESDSANTWVGYGTAAFFIIIFGVVAAGAFRMIRGHKWGRGPVVMLEMLLVPISFYMFGGHAWILATVCLVSAVVALAMLFSPRAVRWAASNY